MGTKFKVTFSYVDNTYWDDGSRYTRHSETFSARDEVLEYIQKALKDGVTITSHTTGQTLRARPKKDDFWIEEIISKDIPWWVFLKDLSYAEEEISNCITHMKLDDLKDIRQIFESEFGEECWKNTYKAALGKSRSI